MAVALQHRVVLFFEPSRLVQEQPAHDRALHLEGYQGSHKCAKQELKSVKEASKVPEEGQDVVGCPLDDLQVDIEAHIDTRHLVAVGEVHPLGGLWALHTKLGEVVAFCVLAVKENVGAVQNLHL